MRRSLLTILIVAAVSALIARAERVSGSDSPPLKGGARGGILDRSIQFDPPAATPAEWIRTADGWQPRTVLAAEPRHAPVNLHPALIASFQLGVSLFALLAFPGRAVPMAATARLRR